MPPAPPSSTDTLGRDDPEGEGGRRSDGRSPSSGSRASSTAAAAGAGPGAGVSWTRRAAGVRLLIHEDRRRASSRFGGSGARVCGRGGRRRVAGCSSRAERSAEGRRLRRGAPLVALWLLCPHYAAGSVLAARVSPLACRDASDADDDGRHAAPQPSASGCCSVRGLLQRILLVVERLVPDSLPGARARGLLSTFGWRLVRGIFTDGRAHPMMISGSDFARRARAFQVPIRSTASSSARCPISPLLHQATSASSRSSAFWKRWSGSRAIAFLDDVVELLVDVGTQALRGRRFLGRILKELVIGHEWRATGDALVEHDAERIDVERCFPCSVEPRACSGDMYTGSP